MLTVPKMPGLKCRKESIGHIKKGSPLDSVASYHSLALPMEKYKSTVVVVVYLFNKHDT